MTSNKVKSLLSFPFPKLRVLELAHDLLVVNPTLELLAIQCPELTCVVFAGCKNVGASKYHQNRLNT